MVALFQSLLSEPFPALWAVNDLRSLKGDFKVATLNSEIESRVFVLDEVECNLENVISDEASASYLILTYLRESFLLQVGDDALTH